MTRNPLSTALKDARLARGLTQEQTAAIVGMSRTTIVSLERGNRPPTEGELDLFAKAYGVEVSQFFAPPPEHVPFIDQLHAAYPGDVEAIGPVVERVETLSLNYRNLSEAMDAPLPRNYPKKYGFSDSLVLSAERIAFLERARLGLSDAPIPHLGTILDLDVGVPVFYLPMPKGCLGVYCFSPKLGGCIAVDSALGDVRGRVVLASLYFRFLSDRPRIAVHRSDQEFTEEGEVADYFARHFLVPRGGLLRHSDSRALALEGSPPAQSYQISPLVRSLAQLYRVSPLLTLEQLEDMGWVRPGTVSPYRVLARDGRLDRYEDPGGDGSYRSLHRTYPARYVHLAIQARCEDLISLDRLTQFLEVAHVD